MNVLVLYAKLPQIGSVKTRLTRGENSLTPEQAYQLYTALLSDLIELFLNTQHDSSYDFFICPIGDSIQFKTMFPGDYQMVVDEGQGDLGRSMFRTINNMLSKKYSHVSILGSDLPFITPERIEESFRGLLDYDMVLGPDQRGGCYLIGSKIPLEILLDIPWSEGRDFQILLDRSKQNSISSKLLAPEMDCDTIEDYHYLREYILRYTDEFKKRMKNTYTYFECFT